MGSRNTKQKEAIIRVLRKTADHADTRWIRLQVRHSLPHISLGTVYGNLKSLTDENLISFLDMGSVSRFDCASGNHAHFHCQKCGGVSNLEATSDPSMDKNNLSPVPTVGGIPPAGFFRFMPLLSAGFHTSRK